VQEFEAYIESERVDLVCGIYERAETLERFRASGLVKIVPFYWERRPSEPHIPASAAGIKLHPYIEDYALTEPNVGNVLRVAAARRLPVLIHLDDRKPNLSRGRLVEPLAREFREITFILAHAGSYAPGVRGKPGESWVSEKLVRELVSEAIDVAGRFENVYIEVSILASRVKAELIARTAPQAKVLLGSDFPIYKGIYGSVRFQEEALVTAGLHLDAISALHDNAFRLFGSMEL
jgi:predicted TIM-barrel fold metal-dependent hydrolase